MRYAPYNDPTIIGRRMYMPGEIVELTEREAAPYLRAGFLLPVNMLPAGVEEKTSPRSTPQPTSITQTESYLAAPGEPESYTQDMSGSAILIDGEVVGEAVELTRGQKAAETRRKNKEAAARLTEAEDAEVEAEDAEVEAEDDPAGEF